MEHTCSISVIIPVYNVELYLASCLDSVFLQTFTNYEIICINDGSTDGSGLILDEYVNKYSQLRVITQINKGLSGARNIGIREAKGEYLFFLDSDDWIEPDSLQILAKKQNGEDLICFNGRRYFENGGIEVPDTGIVEDQMTGWDYYNKYALVSRKFHFVCTVLRIYKREFLLENKLFFREGIYHEDNLFTPLVCHKAARVKVIPDLLYVYRIRSGSITQTFSNKRLLDLILIANFLADYFKELSNIDKSIVYREIAGEYFKGFMPNEIKLYGNNDKILSDSIDWKCFKSVCLYSRQHRMYKLLRMNISLFRGYIYLENFLKLLRYGVRI